ASRRLRCHNRFSMNLETHDQMPPASSSMESVSTRPATLDDLETMLELSARKRRQYERHQPEFWAEAANAKDAQRAFFHMLLTTNEPNAIVRIAEENDRIKAFAIGMIAQSPPVYRPQSICFVDDFPLAPDASWEVHGRAVLEAVEAEAKLRGAHLTNVVCSRQDVEKRRFLEARNLSVAGEWWVGPLLVGPDSHGGARSSAGSGDDSDPTR
ncbi:MAG: N-acetyltransferase family protein, partial [Armatimonadota bacterium]